METNTNTEVTKPVQDGTNRPPSDQVSVSSFTDSLETDSQSLELPEGNEPEVQDSKPKKIVSKLPVKTKKIKEAISCDKTIDDQCNSNDNDKTKGCKGGKHSKPECVECNNVGAHAPTKETLTSRMRIEKSHLNHQSGGGEGVEEYLTPTQRKGQVIRDLKKQVKDLERELEYRSQEISSLKASIGQEAQHILDTKNAEVREAKDSLVAMTTKYEELTLSYEESVKAVNVLEETLREFREKAAAQEVHHKNMYLEMYEKGKRSADFEREDELEMLAKTGKTKVTMRELQRKLSESQAELAKWQSLRREEMYEVAETPETEAESTLKFLKDSFFHFLTKEKDSDDHLRAMIQIFNFSEVQKKKITKGLQERKKKKSSV